MWKTPRSLAAAGVALAAGLGAAAVAVPAFAAQDPVLTPDQQTALQAQIDDYRSCLESHGATLPEKPEDGTKPEITDEQRDAIRSAREACADERPDRPELSDEQRAELQSQRDEHRACMEEQLSAAGITKPEKPAEGSETSGERPARPQLTDDQKAAIRSARDACAELEPNLGVEGIGPMGRGGPMGHGGPGGRMGRGGPDGPLGTTDQGSAQPTSNAV